MAAESRVAKQSSKVPQVRSGRSRLPITILAVVAAVAIGLIGSLVVTSYRSRLGAIHDLATAGVDVSYISQTWWPSDSACAADSVRLPKGFVTQSVVDAVCRLGTVRELRAQDTTLTDTDIRRLVSSNPHLMYLNLDGTRISDVGAKTLQSLKKLKWVTLSRTAISDDSLRVLAKVESVVEIDVSRTLVRGEAFSAVAKLPNLQTLVITRKKIDEHFLLAFMEVRPDVEVVW